MPRNLYREVDALGEAVGDLNDAKRDHEDRLRAIEDPLARIKWALGILVTGALAAGGAALWTWLTR